MSQEGRVESWWKVPHSAGGLATEDECQCWRKPVGLLIKRRCHSLKYLGGQAGNMMCGKGGGKPWGMVTPVVS